MTSAIVTIRTDEERHRRFILSNAIEDRRKKPTIANRLTPCRVCSFPLSQSHHLLPFAHHGHGLTVPLCGTCHDLFHVCFAARGGTHRTRALRLFADVTVQCLNTSEMKRVEGVVELVREVNALEAESSRRILDEADRIVAERKENA